MLVAASYFFLLPSAFFGSVCKAGDVLGGFNGAVGAAVLQGLKFCLALRTGVIWQQITTIWY